MGYGPSVAVSCGVDCRCDSNCALLWLWLAATAPIRPLARELPHATRVALENQKPKTKNQKTQLKKKKRHDSLKICFPHQKPLPMLAKDKLEEVGLMVDD